MQTPPQRLKQQVRLASRQDAGAALSRFDATGRPLPVLEAFKEFLEVERQRARARLTLLTSLFCALLLAVVGAGAVAGWLYASRSQRGMNELTEVMESTRREVREVRDRSGTRIEDLAVQSAELRTGINEARSALDQIRSESLSSTRVRDREMKDLVAILGLLQEQNTTLRLQVKELRDWVSEAVPPTPASALIGPLTGPDDTPPPPVASLPSVPLPSSEEIGDGIISLEISMPGASPPIPLRVPSPL